MIKYFVNNNIISLASMWYIQELYSAKKRRKAFVMQLHPSLVSGRKPVDFSGTCFTVTNRASLEQHTALLLDLGGLWAKHSTDGLIKHRF